MPFPDLDDFPDTFNFLKPQFSLGFMERHFYLNKKKKSVMCPDRGCVSNEEKKTFSTRLLMNSLFFYELQRAEI